jgi:hypothetical protein
MKLVYSFLFAAWLAGQCYSQTTISGKIFGVDASHLDSVQIMLKDGTGDTTYCKGLISKDGTFSLSSGKSGGLLLDVNCPGFKSVEVALVVPCTTIDTVDVKLIPSS